MKTPNLFNPDWICWELSPEIGNGYYCIYAKKDLFEIKIHDFYFHKDSYMEFDLLESLSITKYDSISGEELSPYRSLPAACIKTFIGGCKPYKVLIHKKIPIRSVGIGIMPAYYNDYLQKQYPDEYTNPLPAFQQIDQTTTFPEMAMLLHQLKTYRGEGISAGLFYEGKVAEALSLIVEAQKKNKAAKQHLSAQDITALQEVTVYILKHYASDIPSEKLAQIACMGTTKLKAAFKQYHHCTITAYIQQRRMDRAKLLLSETDLTIGQAARAVGYSTSSRFAELFRRSTGILPGEYRSINAMKKDAEF